MKTHAESVDMLTGSLQKNILRFSLPVAVSGVFQYLYHAADMVVVARWGSENSLAAVGASSSVVSLFLNLFIGFSVGVGVVVSTSLGAGDERAVSETVHTSIPFAFFAGLLVSAGGFFCTDFFLTRLSTPADIFASAGLYLKIYFWRMPGNLVYNYSAAILRADGDSVRPLRYMTVGGVLNIILNVIFVAFFRMDVAGVALATVITESLSAILTLGALARKKGICRFVFRRMRFYPQRLKQVLRMGLPAGIQDASFSVSTLVMQGFINSFGTAVIAGTSACCEILNLAHIFTDSFSHAAVNFTGQNYGAKQYRRIPEIHRTCCRYQLLLGGAVCLLTVVFCRPLLRFFVKTDAAALAAGVLRMRIVGLVTFLHPMINTATGIMRGMGRSMLPMALSVGGIVGIRLLYMYTFFMIPKYHTLTVLYFTFPVSWALTLSVSLWVLKRMYQNVLRTNQ